MQASKGIIRYQVMHQSGPACTLWKFEKKKKDLFTRVKRARNKTRKRKGNDGPCMAIG
jgi:hypothetical protein